MRLLDQLLEVSAITMTRILGRWGKEKLEILIEMLTLSRYLRMREGEYEEKNTLPVLTEDLKQDVKMA